MIYRRISMLFLKHVAIFCFCVACFAVFAVIMLAIVNLSIDIVKDIKDSLSNKQDEDD